MPPASICDAPACGHTVEGSVHECPSCGKRMRTPTAVRWLGLVMLMYGVFLTGLMGIITHKMLPMLLNSGQEV